ncbi:MAG: lipoate-protein ligase A [Chlamydiales bacterium]|jgi:lipoate-protein ligase A
MASETWRLLSTWDESAEFHMGFDQAQLDGGCEPPTLRLYTWLPDALSLGYFQPKDDVRDLGLATHVVRRMTGGGAIHHVNELTFSITVRHNHPLYRGPVGPSYVRVHAAIASALSEVAVEADLRGDTSVSSDRSGTGMCFHDSTALDLVWNGRKGVGSAQRRKATGTLHHGSIKLSPSSMESGVATASEGGQVLTPQEFAPILCRAFEAELDIQLAPERPQDDEIAAAQRLGPHYSSTEMLERR